MANVEGLCVLVEGLCVLFVREYFVFVFEGFEGFCVFFLFVIRVY